MNSNLDDLFAKLHNSRFRSGFRLRGPDLTYARSRNPEQIAAHARTFLEKRLFVAAPEKDGRQTPYRGHPVFVAQHATGTCCRSCLQKWHAVKKGRALSDEERDYVVGVIMGWLQREVSKYPDLRAGAGSRARRSDQLEL